jgi:hypothetical protein
MLSPEKAAFAQPGSPAPKLVVGNLIPHPANRGCFDLTDGDTARPVEMQVPDDDELVKRHTAQSSTQKSLFRAVLKVTDSLFQ